MVQEGGATPARRGKETRDMGGEKCDGGECDEFVSSKIEIGNSKLGKEVRAALLRRLFFAEARSFGV